MPLPDKYTQLDLNVLRHSLFAKLSGPEVLSTKFQLYVKTKMPKNEEVSRFKSLRCCIYHANKCFNANICWHFNIYEQDKSRAKLR